MNSRNASFRERGLGGALWAPLAVLFYVSLVLVGLLLAAWCIDCIFVFGVWSEGLEQLRAVLAADLARAASFPGGTTVLRLAVQCANALYALVFEATGLHAMALRFAEDAALSIPDTVARSTYIAQQDVIAVAMLGTQIFGVRLGVMAAALPVALLVYAVAAADGWTARAVRRARGGRESSSLYHRFKYLQLLGIAGVISIGLLVPVSFDPRWLWWGAAPPFALLVRLQWRYYKKHL